MKHTFDVVIIGAGHAGTEAAMAADRIGVRTALVTMRETDIGVLSCNPALGGVGKGHLLREIDALGGALASWGDRSAIQYRLLNASKGPAVQGPRAQIDCDIYRQVASAGLRNTGVTLIVGEAADLLPIEGGLVLGLADGSEITARRVVLTTGTFLGGEIHIGHDSRPAGRFGDAPSRRLADRLRDLGIVTGRLKTGTPPRLDGRTIAWESLDRQDGDAEPEFLSFRTERVFNRQIACGVAETNDRTHQIIRSNLERSALYGGRISGKGPRYCPSIEDKIVRFSDRASHTIYLEPEGLASDLVYPNGISTSLPADVQIDLVRSIAGLARAEIVRPGYAVEYDFCDPRHLESSLECRAMPRLYLAGQINGTTGYEEAGAQGLVAGANAALAVLGRAPLIPDRQTSYIGVMVDDLTTRGASEPYRMFTSRAEYRLALRCDNAEHRLSEMARASGLLDDRHWQHQLARRTEEDALREAIRSNYPGRSPLAAIREHGDAAFNGVGRMPSARARDHLAAEALYEPYLERQGRDRDRLAANAAILIPRSLGFDLPGLTTQQREDLQGRGPKTLADALASEVMTPAAGLVLLAAIRSHDVSRETA